MSRFVTQDNVLKLLPMDDDPHKAFYEELHQLHLNQSKKSERRQRNKAKENPWKKAGECFKLIRAKLDLGQQDFATLVKVSKGTISFWECGKKRPRYHILLAIKSILPAEYSKLIKMEDFGYASNSKKSDNADI